MCILTTFPLSWNSQQEIDYYYIEAAERRLVICGGESRYFISSVNVLIGSTQQFHNTWLKRRESWAKTTSVVVKGIASEREGCMEMFCATSVKAGVNTGQELGWDFDLYA